MRLTCPNCDAQYEVPDEVIPENGREVQCSNCNNTWFQHHPNHMPVAADEQFLDESTDPQEIEEQPPEPPQEPAPEPKARELDTAVTDVLRQEAAREQAAREAENQGTIETQPDLGLTEEPIDAQRRAEQAQARMAKLKGEPDYVEEYEQRSRGEMLPDVDEINSSLDANNEGDLEDQVYFDEETQEQLAAQRSSGFGRGFLFIIILALLLLAIYIFAPDLSQQVPAAEPYLNQYVSTVDQLRAQLDGLISKGLGWLDGLTSESQSAN